MVGITLFISLLLCEYPRGVLYSWTYAVGSLQREVYDDELALHELYVTVK